MEEGIESRQRRLIDQCHVAFLENLRNPKQFYQRDFAFECCSVEGSRGKVLSWGIIGKQIYRLHILGVIKLS